MQRIAIGSREMVEAFMEVCDYRMHCDGGTRLMTVDEWNDAHPGKERKYWTVRKSRAEVVLAVTEGWERYRTTIEKMQTAWQYFSYGWNARK